MDDTPLVPGDARRDYEQGEQAHQILEDAESDLRGWESTGEPTSPTSAELGANLRPETSDEQAYNDEAHSDGGREEVSSYRKEEIPESYVTQE